MKFEVRYPGTAPHDVELQGTVAVLGRDPSCDLVLSDSKCSRRHAVLEAGPQGIVIRDAGSANGVFVNDKKVERAALREGDVIRLGDVVLKVLPEEMPGTLMMSPEEMEAGAPVAEAPVPAAPPAPAAPPSRVPAEAPVPPVRSATRPPAAVPGVAISAPPTSCSTNPIANAPCRKSSATFAPFAGSRSDPSSNSRMSRCASS